MTQPDNRSPAERGITARRLTDEIQPARVRYPNGRVLVRDNRGQLVPEPAPNQ